MNQNDIAYIAGLFDGEGTVDYKQRWEKRAKGRKYKIWRVTVAIEMTDQHVLEWLQGVLGFGTLNERKKRPGRKRIWRWRCVFREALVFAKLLWPHTQTKLHKLEQIIDHYDTKDEDKPSAKIIYLNERKKTNVLSTIT